jgi:hypothetical protein
MKRKLVIFFSLVIMIASACSSKNISVKDYIRNSDSASIAFYKSDSINTIRIKDKISIQKLGGYIDAGKTMENGKCQDDGSIWFYEGQKKKMQVDFSLNNECSYFSYMMNDKIYARSMSAEATKYLNGIMEIATDSL